MSDNTGIIEGISRTKKVMADDSLMPCRVLAALQIALVLMDDVLLKLLA